MHPKTKPNLLVDELPDETLVYDLDRHRAHCLNATAGFLLRAADGTRSRSELETMAEAEFGPVGSHEVVGVGLERLHKAGLIEWEAPPGDARMTRRETLKKIAAVGILLPTVMTLVSPHPAQAATGLPTSSCNLQNVGICCSNNKLCVQLKNGSFKCQGPSC